MQHIVLSEMLHNLNFERKNINTDGCLLLEPEDVLYIHVTLLPYISGSNELKSKPTQHSVKELQSYGIKPDVLVCRSDLPIPEGMKEKIALFCNVRKENVIHNSTVDVLYEVPLMLEREGLAKVVCEHLALEKAEPQNEKWEKMIDDIIAIKTIIKKTWDFNFI